MIEHITKSRLIAILRGSTSRHLADAAEVLQDEGLPCIELPLTTPGALAALEEAAQRVPTMGAGTVLTATQARDAINAGARFLVSPAVCPPVIEYARERNITVLPGALTPTEIHQAHLLECELVKLFPSVVGGPEYVSALLGPYPGARLVPTGRIELDDAQRYLMSGAVALGVGSTLAGDALETGDLDGLRVRAREWRERLS